MAMATIYATDAEAQKLVPSAVLGPIHLGKAYVVVHTGQKAPTDYPTEVILWLGHSGTTPPGARVVAYTAATYTPQELTHAYKEACENRVSAVKLAQDASALVQAVRRAKHASSRALIERSTGGESMVHTVTIDTVSVGSGRFVGTTHHGLTFVDAGGLHVDECELGKMYNGKAAIVLFVFDSSSKSAPAQIATLMQSGHLEYQAVERKTLDDAEKLTRVLLGVMNRLNLREDVLHRSDQLSEAQLAQAITKDVGKLQLQ